MSKIREALEEISGSGPRPDLGKLPEVVKHKPTQGEVSFQQFDGTNACQWHQRFSVYWNAVGPMFSITELDQQEDEPPLTMPMFARRADLDAAKVEADALLPQKEGQAKTMTICAGPDTTPQEVGHWYSPNMVREILAARAERGALDAARFRHMVDDMDSSALLRMIAEGTDNWRAILDAAMLPPAPEGEK